MTKLAEDIMNRQMRYVESSATLQEAHDLMSQYSIRHLLVQEPKTSKLVGMISDRDIKKFISPFATATSATDRDKATLQIEVAKVMVKNLITAKPKDKVSSVVDIILQKKISAVPVVDPQGKAVGIITTTDALKLLMTLL